MYNDTQLFNFPSILVFSHTVILLFFFIFYKKFTCNVKGERIFILIFSVNLICQKYLKEKIEKFERRLEHSELNELKETLSCEINTSKLLLLWTLIHNNQRCVGELWNHNHHCKRYQETWISPLLLMKLHQLNEVGVTSRLDGHSNYTNNT